MTIIFQLFAFNLIVGAHSNVLRCIKNIYQTPPFSICGSGKKRITKSEFSFDHRSSAVVIPDWQKGKFVLQVISTKNQSMYTIDLKKISKRFSRINFVFEINKGGWIKSNRGVLLNTNLEMGKTPPILSVNSGTNTIGIKRFNHNSEFVSSQYSMDSKLVDRSLERVLTENLENWRRNALTLYGSSSQGLYSKCGPSDKEKFQRRKESLVKTLESCKSNIKNKAIRNEIIRTTAVLEKATMESFFGFSSKSNSKSSNQNLK